MGIGIENIDKSYEKQSYRSKWSTF